MLEQLSTAQAGATIITQFLKAQDAEQDWDASLVMERCVSECLRKQAEEIDDLIRVINPVSHESTEQP